MKKSIILALIVVISLATAGVAPASAEPSSVTITQFNVSDGGDGAVVEVGDKNMIVDSGPSKGDNEPPIRYLSNERSAFGVEHVVVTNDDPAHVGDMASGISLWAGSGNGVDQATDLGSGSTSVFSDYETNLNDNSVPRNTVSKGDTFTYAGLTFEVVSAGDTLAFTFDHGDVSVLWTSRLDSTAEEQLANDLEGQEFDVVQVGDEQPVSTDLLNAIGIGHMAISNSYDTGVSTGLSDELDVRNISVTWTAAHGTTKMVSDGSTVTVKTQYDRTSDPASIDSAAEATDRYGWSTSHLLDVTAPTYDYGANVGGSDEPPVDLNVSTGTAVNISTSEATLNGSVDTLSGVDSANAMFQYQEQAGGSWSNTTAQTVSSTGEFDETVSALDSNTTYEFRAVVQNGSNIANGSVVSFSTLAADGSTNTTDDDTANSTDDDPTNVTDGDTTNSTDDDPRGSAVSLDMFAVGDFSGELVLLLVGVFLIAVGKVGD